MRLISIVLSLTLATCVIGESTQLLQIPRVMRKALGSRNYQIQVPNVHPVDPPQPEGHVEVEEEEKPIAKVQKKLAKHKGKGASSAHGTRRSGSHSKKEEKSSAKSHHLQALKSSDSDAETKSASKQAKLRKSPKANKKEESSESNEGEDQVPVTRAHYRKRRHTSTTTKTKH